MNTESPGQIVVSIGVMVITQVLVCAEISPLMNSARKESNVIIFLMILGLIYLRVGNSYVLKVPSAFKIWISDNAR